MNTATFSEADLNQEVTINIADKDGSHDRGVMALVAGPIALHHSIEHDDLWSISHIPTRRALIVDLPLDEALSLLDELGRFKAELESITAPNPSAKKYRDIVALIGRYARKIPHVR